MSNKRLPFNCTSADFEKAAINRFRSLAICVHQNCKVFREPWDCSTVLCIDFEDCPSFLEATKEQAHLLVRVAQQLGLANSVIFRIGNKVMGWTTIRR
ncbi:MAG: hypothetical protein AB4426_25760 [Xenococcaceae cyanobacterium]